MDRETLIHLRQLGNRLESATSGDERIDALRELQHLTRNYPEEIGDHCMRAVLELLQEQGGYEEYMEALDLILRLINSKNTSAASSNTARILAEPGKSSDNVDILLELLAHDDMTIGVMSSQILMELHNRAGTALEHAIQLCPEGMTKLLRRLPDNAREEVRNQAIVLLLQLTDKNEEMKKTLAFNEGFDVIFRIIKSEGGAEDSGLVVQDCLHILKNIVTNSETCQRLFYGTGDKWHLQLAKFFNSHLEDFVLRDLIMENIDLNGIESNEASDSPLKARIATPGREDPALQSPWYDSAHHISCGILAMNCLSGSLSLPKGKAVEIGQQVEVCSGADVISGAVHWLGRRGPTEFIEPALKLLHSIVAGCNAQSAAILSQHKVIMTGARRGRNMPHSRAISDAGLQFGKEIRGSDEEVLYNITLLALLAEMYIVDRRVVASSVSFFWCITNTTIGVGSGCPVNSDKEIQIRQTCLDLLDKILEADQTASILLLQHIIAPPPPIDLDMDSGHDPNDPNASGLEIEPESLGVIILRGIIGGCMVIRDHGHSTESLLPYTQVLSTMLIHGGDISRELASTITLGLPTLAPTPNPHLDPNSPNKNITSGNNESFLIFILETAKMAVEKEDGAIAALGLLQALATALSGCDRSVHQIMASSGWSTIESLVLSQPTSATVPASVHCMAALCMGCVCLVLPQKEGLHLFSRIDSSIGLSKYTSMLDVAARSTSSNKKQDILFCNGFRNFYESHVEAIRKSIFEYFAKGGKAVSSTFSTPSSSITETTGSSEINENVTDTQQQGQGQEPQLKQVVSVGNGPAPAPSAVPVADAHAPPTSPIIPFSTSNGSSSSSNSSSNNVAESVFSNQSSNVTISSSSSSSNNNNNIGSSNVADNVLDNLSSNTALLQDASALFGSVPSQPLIPESSIEPSDMTTVSAIPHTQTEALTPTIRVQAQARNDGFDDISLSPVPEPSSSSTTATDSASVLNTASSMSIGATTAESTFVTQEHDTHVSSGLTPPPVPQLYTPEPSIDPGVLAAAQAEAAALRRELSSLQAAHSSMREQLRDSDAFKKRVEDVEMSNELLKKELILANDKNSELVSQMRDNENSQASLGTEMSVLREENKELARSHTIELDSLRSELEELQKKQSNPIDVDGLSSDQIANLRSSLSIQPLSMADPAKDKAKPTTTGNGVLGLVGVEEWEDSLWPSLVNCVRLLDKVVGIDRAIDVELETEEWYINMAACTGHAISFSGKPTVQFEWLLGALYDSVQGLNMSADSCTMMVEDCMTEASIESDVEFTEESSSVARMVEAVDILSRIAMQQSESIKSLNDKFKQSESSRQDLELQVKTAAVEAQKQRLLNSQHTSVGGSNGVTPPMVAASIEASELFGSPAPSSNDITAPIPSLGPFDIPSTTAANVNINTANSATMMQSADALFGVSSAPSSTSNAASSSGSGSIDDVSSGANALFKDPQAVELDQLQQQEHIKKLEEEIIRLKEELNISSEDKKVAAQQVKELQESEEGLMRQIDIKRNALESHTEDKKIALQQIKELQESEEELMRQLDIKATAIESSEMKANEDHSTISQLHSELEQLRMRVTQGNDALKREKTLSAELEEQLVAVRAIAAELERNSVTPVPNRYPQSAEKWYPNSNDNGSSNDSFIDNNNSSGLPLQDASGLFGGNSSSSSSSSSGGVEVNATNMNNLVDPVLNQEREKMRLEIKSLREQVARGRVQTFSSSPSYMGVGTVLGTPTSTPPKVQIQTQNSARILAELQMERRRLRDLQDEHSDLLGLIAQQELELKIFQDKLEKATGSIGVHETVKLVEEQAIKRYGVYINYRDDMNTSADNSEAGMVNGQGMVRNNFENTENYHGNISHRDMNTMPFLSVDRIIDVESESEVGVNTSNLDASYNSDTLSGQWAI